MTDWTDEETDDPLYADRRNFYKVDAAARLRVCFGERGPRHPGASGLDGAQETFSTR